MQRRRLAAPAAAAVVLLALLAVLPPPGQPTADSRNAWAGERGGAAQQRLTQLYNFDYVCKRWGCWDTGAGLKWGRDHDGVPGGGHVGGQVPFYPFATYEQHEANWNQYMDSEEMQSFDAKEAEFQDYLLKSTYYDVAGSREEGLGDWGKPYDNYVYVPPVDDENGIVADDGVNMAWAEY